jgi:hypothetical protein
MKARVGQFWDGSLAGEEIEEHTRRSSNTTSLLITTLLVFSDHNRYARLGLITVPQKENSMVGS